MGKKEYRIIDSRGRVYLPKDMRRALVLEPGDFVKLTDENDRIAVRKVHLFELGDHSPEAAEAYVSAAASAMPREKQIEIAARLLEQARKEKV